jgi:hypothetical protein
MGIIVADSISTPYGTVLTDAYISFALNPISINVNVLDEATNTKTYKIITRFNTYVDKTCRDTKYPLMTEELCVQTDTAGIATIYEYAIEDKVRGHHGCVKTESDY